MLYLKKIPSLEITTLTQEKLVIERLRNLTQLYANLAIVLIVGIASLYATINYNKEIRSASIFLFMACFVPILFTSISASRLINTIRGWKLDFDKKSNQFILNNQPRLALTEVKEIVLNSITEEDSHKNWTRFELYIKTIDNKKVILATSRQQGNLNRYADAISDFLDIQLVQLSTGGENKNHIISRDY